MKKSILVFTLTLSSLAAAGQAQDLAVAAYTEAEEAFANKQYTKALADLERCETLLGDPNVKTTRLRAQSLRKLAFADSARYYPQYTSSVREFEQLARKKGLDEGSMKEVTAQVNSFSTDRRSYQKAELEGQLAAWPPEVLGVAIGMAESNIPAGVMSAMKASKATAGAYQRKDDDLKKTGITEMTIDPATQKVTRVVAHTHAGDGANALEGSNVFSARFQKLLAAFGKENITEKVYAEDPRYKNAQIFEYSAKINPSCRYTVTMVMIKYKKWFVSESYEIL